VIHFLTKKKINIALQLFEDLDTTTILQLRLTIRETIVPFTRVRLSPVYIFNISFNMAYLASTYFGNKNEITGRELHIMC